uniref:Ornithine cyclodeaminase/mu-crystallin n=1 Tax=Phaselicystis flava TaxID=525924 RepID=A0A3S5GYH0_9BACT|nr:ornithine cyclodeaminase/mu-crystallin [Phaselicystis flava]
MDFRIVNGKTIHRLIHDDLTGCVRVVTDAYLAHHRGESVNPNSYFLRFPDRPDARIIALPAFLADGFDVSGIKWIASYPANIRQNIPRASAVLVLNRTDTGYPFACLEASIISAARTAASAALGAAALNEGRRASRAIGIVGTGLIARYIYTFLVRLGWEIDRVHLFDTSPAEAERFKSAVIDRDRHREVLVSPDVDTLLRSSDLIVFATSSGTPYVDDPALLAHNPVVLHVSLRDLSPRVILAAYNVVDDVGHVMNASTSVHLAEQQTGRRDFVAGTIAGLIRGDFELDRSRPRIFSPFGLGVLDLAVGKWVYDRAVEEGSAICIDDFFFEMTR